MIDNPKQCHSFGALTQFFGRFYGNLALVWFTLEGVALLVEAGLGRPHLLCQNLCTARNSITLRNVITIVGRQDSQVVAGCLSLFMRLVAEAIAVRVAQEIVKWLTGGHLQNLLATFLAKVGLRAR